MTPISRADRRAARRERVEKIFAERAAAALDLFEVLELAWHDCYAEISPPEDIIDDLLLLSKGDLAELVAATRLAVTDWRDVKMAVLALRARRPITK